MHPGNPAGSAAPPSPVRGAESKPGNKWWARPLRQGYPGDCRVEHTRAGSAGLRPPRPGAGCGTPTRAATTATREPAASPAIPHLLLHSSSPHTLKSEKRRPRLRSGWPGTDQSAPTTNSQKSSPGAAAMLWPPRARVTRRPPAGGAGGGAGAGGAGGGAQEAGCCE